MVTFYCRVALFASALSGLASCAAAPRADVADATPDVAESAAGETCAAKLSPEASLVYHTAAPDMRQDTQLPVILRKKVMFLVFSDQLMRNDARPAAEQAASCLKLLQR